MATSRPLVRRTEHLLNDSPFVAVSTPGHPIVPTEVPMGDCCRFANHCDDRVNMKCPSSTGNDAPPGAGNGHLRVGSKPRHQPQGVCRDLGPTHVAGSRVRDGTPARSCRLAHAWPAPRRGVPESECAATDHGRRNAAAGRSLGDPDRPARRRPTRRPDDRVLRNLFARTGFRPQGQQARDQTAPSPDPATRREHPPVEPS